ncbi:hypothetical protein DAPPUDRAFT_253707 [Daphnia pulex]|uniref:N-acetyltransferase domain-containing protein n=1 Tax=Daphnia pulex TaxID=6669 RepID=E9H5N8_DAPPU|nr:hypothetical protein DAPPUDRAFT_253707 [Daphnia pulex]|eukprot:EFX72904.1 hypothetical protein DAPPUDRAFT_253707 [Daphnia pulex]
MAQALSPPMFFPAPCRGHPNLIFDLVGPTDVNEVCEFVMNEFFHRFPLKDVLHVETEVRPWIGQYIAHVTSKNISIVLRDVLRGYRIIAVAINDVDYKERQEKDINLITFADPNLRPGWFTICSLLSKLNEGLSYNVDPIISMDIIAIGESYCNQGLAYLCTQVTIELAEARGIHLIRIEVVNDFMSAMFASLGFQKIREIDMNELIIGGEKPFAVTDFTQKARMESFS